WDLSTGKELWQAGIMGFDDRGFRVLEFLSDGQSLVLFDRSTNPITVRDRVSGTQRREFATMQQEEMQIMALSPDEKFLLIGTTGSAVRVRELAAGKELPMLGGHKGLASSVAMSHDSKTVVTGGLNSDLHVWDWRMVSGRWLCSGVKSPCECLI